MLIYHPAFDGYHCVFRMLAITTSIPSLEVDKARILDFFLVFPGTVKSIRLPEELRGLRLTTKEVANPFRDPVSNAATFMDMRHIQEAALKSIAASGLIERQTLSLGKIDRTAVRLPESLRGKVEEYLAKNDALNANILEGLARLPLLGQNGLKDRSKLMDFRYDFA